MGKKGITSSQCKNSFQNVPVKQLLDGVFPTERDLPGEKIADHPKKIFFSYSKSDRKHLLELLKHLAPLKQNKKIQPWNDADILPGEKWDDKIRRELSEAHIIVLLVSSDFLATTYIQNVEIETAMARHKRREAVVIPIVLRPCDWESILGELNALPFKAQPVTTWKDRDSAWLDVVKGIAKTIEDFTQYSTTSP